MIYDTVDDLAPAFTYRPPKWPHKRPVYSKQRVHAIPAIMSGTLEVQALIYPSRRNSGNIVYERSCRI